MRKCHDEIEVIFERSTRDDEKHPYVRRVIVHLYGSDSAETCIGVARQQHNLPVDQWNVVSVSGKGY